MYSLLNGIQLHYEVLGEGDPILLVHGWGGSLVSLEPLGKNLSQTNKVIIVDLPGFGQSQTPPPEWGVEEYADALVELLKVLKISKVHYFGHSFGGSIGIYLSAKKPKLIKSLILCNSSYKRTDKKSTLVRLFHHIFPKNNPPLRKLIYSVFFRSSDLLKYPQLEQNFRKIVKYDLTELANDISVRTLILWGEHDSITPAAWAHELHEKIKDSKLKLFPNERHGLPLRNPEAVADEVLIFLNT